MRLFKIISSIFMLFVATTAFANTAEKNMYTEDKTAIVVTPDQPQFTIKLKSNPTTGYSWFLRGYDSHFIQPVKHIFEPAVDKKLMGAPGYDYWTFRVKPEGFYVPLQTQIRLVYLRPWEATDQSKIIVFRVSTTSVP